MGLSAPSAYESDNPLLEATPYFKKYVFSGMGERAGQSSRWATMRESMNCF